MKFSFVPREDYLGCSVVHFMWKLFLRIEARRGNGRGQEGGAPKTPIGERGEQRYRVVATRAVSQSVSQPIQVRVNFRIHETPYVRTIVTVSPNSNSNSNAMEDGKNNKCAFPSLGFIRHATRGEKGQTRIKATLLGRLKQLPKIVWVTKRKEQKLFT